MPNHTRKNGWLARTAAWAVSAACLLAVSSFAARPSSEDGELLGKAIEYFQSGKFHESLLIFDKLDRRYNLNPRFRAFMAVCYFYDWNDEKTCEYLDSLIPQLEPYAPHERSIYYYINAESHFNLKQYRQAITYYEQALNVCYNNEKADALYRIGYCYLFEDNYPVAYEYFNSALSYYRQFRNTTADQPRILQIERMTAGLKTEIIASEKLSYLAEQQTVRDTLKSHIINDIDLSDIYEDHIIIETDDTHVSTPQK